MSVPPALWTLTGDKRALHDVHERRQRAIGQGHVEIAGRRTVPTPDETVEHVERGGLGEIERERTLAAIAREVIRAGAGIPVGVGLQKRRPPLPRVVPEAGAFDLYDVGAQVRENLRANWTRQDARQVEHL